MKKRILGIVSTITLLTGAYTIYNNESNTNEDYKVVQVHGDFAMDITNKAELVGSSENVFVAKVLEEIGTLSADPNLPNTQYKVSVEENIKGKLNGEQIVNHFGGFKTEDGERILIKFENQELLQPGETYIFSTIKDDDNNWHNSVPGYGEVPLAEYGEFSLQSKQRQGSLVQEFYEAFENQEISPIMERQDLELVNGLVEE